MQVDYVFDPLCGWCYGASRLVQALAAAPSVSLRLWPGALFPEPLQVGAGMRSHIVESDKRIAALTGVEFGAAYLARIGDPGRAVTLWSVPVIAALAAAPEKARIAMLEALQRAHYVQGRDLADAGVLAEVARETGLDAAAFGARMQDRAHAQAAAQWIRESREMMGRTGVGGFPAFLAERDGRLVPLDHQSAYADPQAWVTRLAAA